jgi:hypothetical protein
MGGKGIMGKHEKLLMKVLRGVSDMDIVFDDLRNLPIRLGFEERISGGHHIFRKAGVEDKINLQREGTQAKP